MFLTYGNDPCPLCGQRHRMREEPRARRLALQVMAELSTTLAGRITGGRSQRFMMGVLMQGHTVLISRSGAKTGALQSAVKPLGRLGIRDAHTNALQRYQVSIAPHVRPPYTSAGGCPIDVGELEAIRPPGVHPQMGSCAAPHLILEARRRGLNLSTASLSEIWYHPNTQRRTEAIEKGQENYDHGISAYHCESCRLLVPALLCPCNTASSAGLIALHEAKIRGAATVGTSGAKIQTGVSVSALRKKFE